MRRPGFAALVAAIAGLIVALMLAVWAVTQ